MYFHVNNVITEIHYVAVILLSISSSDIQFNLLDFKNHLLSIKTHFSTKYLLNNHPMEI